MFEITRDLVRFELKNYLKGTPKGIKFMVINTEEQLEKAVLKAKLIGNIIEKLDENTYIVVTANKIVFISTDKFIVRGSIDRVDARYRHTELFSNTKYTDIDLTNLVFLDITNMSMLFYNTKAKTINLGDINTSQVTNMESMFEQSEVKEIIGLDRINTCNVTSMSRMFTGCNINNIDISKFDISKTTNMDNMFSYCTAKTISLNNLKASSLLSAQGMFKNCKAKVRLPKDKETAHILDCELTKYENNVEIIR